MSLPNLPHRFTEAAFRRYEDVIRRAVDTHPTVLYVDPRPLASVTFACRLRDAMRSLHENVWPSRVDFEKFQDCYPYLVVAERAGQVCIGTKVALKAAETTPVGTLTQPVGLVIQNPTITEVEALAVLCHARRLPVPIKLCGVIDIHLVARLEDMYDVAFTAENETTHLLV